MNIFDQPEIIEIGGISLPIWNGFNFLEKAAYWELQAKQREEQVRRLYATSSRIAEKKEISIAEASQLLKDSQKKVSDATELIDFASEIVQIQEKQHLANIETDYELAAIILCSRTNDNWLESNKDSLNAIAIEQIANAPDNPEQLIKEITVIPSKRLSCQTRRLLFSALTRSMPPAAFREILDYTLSELNEGEQVEEAIEDEGKPQSAQTNLEQLPTKNLNSSLTAV